jgi:hypothetical protein
MWCAPGSARSARCDANGRALRDAALASQKHHCSLYLMSAYGDADRDAWLTQAFARAGKKLDRGTKARKQAR